MRITKAVVPAAGLGTRFLPATKTVPKELLPIVDTPTLQYIVREVADSGIQDVLLITGRGKNAILDHFDYAPELEAMLEREGKHELLHGLREARSLVNVVSIRQPEPKGLGHAVLCAKRQVHNEPFAVLLGDDLVDSAIPCTRQMIEIFERYNKSVVALMRVPDETVSDYGICAGTLISERVYELDTMIEKPTREEAPSNLAIIGRYILTPAIFKYLEEISLDTQGEIQLTDAMSRLMKEEGFIGYEFSGRHYDAGDKLGFLQAGIAFGLKRRDIGPKLRMFLREILES